MASEEKQSGGGGRGIGGMASPIRKKKSLVYNQGNIKRKVKRVLVTGGCGFIGSHLIDALMKKGYDVLCAG